ncbi:MAG TPA: WcaF family extracellular polysaccharide biosynthesis acetyltransferase [Chthonomonadaceae bacterium]|nr:WcaF family extracellular polysaccharide biosynthesis acetyltransferase [Chthonomonadaceae bacterium]
MFERHTQAVVREEANGTVDFSLYRNPPTLNKGRGFIVRALWHCVNALFLQNPLNPSSALKVFLLRLFGAKIGRGALLKPGLNVKSPWFLELGDNCWLGERVWLDSLAPVKIGSNVCISQDVYLCCGNHDWTDPAFGKSVHPITIEDGVWVAVRATILPGVTLGTHSVITACAVVTKDTEPYMVYAGNPAVPIKKRVVQPHAATQTYSARP